MVLEGLVSSLLNRFLGMYIRNFDPKQLNVGLFSGEVKLRDLELRKEALDQLKLPINVVEGHIGNLTLTIPFSNLRGQPVKVAIEDVFLLAAPKEDAEWDEEEEEARRQKVKIEKLDSAEILKDKNVETQSPEEAAKNQSFTASLVDTIVNNLQVTIKNIHVRYEDSISAPGHPFALGITLEEFSAVSTDGEWKPTYIQKAAGTTYKLATLGALAVYWDTDTDLLGTGREADVPGQAKVASHDEMMTKFKEMIPRESGEASTYHQFILKPVSGQAKLEMDRSGKVGAPKVKAGLIFDEIGLVLDDDQYRDTLMMVDLFHYFIRHQEYKKYQPKGVTPKEDPRAWLKFAGNAILSKIHERNRQWTWDYFRERRDDRKKYIELFKKKKRDPASLSPQDSAALNNLEWKLNYEDLRFFRSLARSQLRKENVGVKKAPPPKQKQGWVAWAWGSKPEGETTEEEVDTTISEEEKKELYDAIDWDEKQTITESIDLPRETVQARIDASLKTGSFTLKRDVHGKATEVISMYFDNFRAMVLQRPDSFLADVSLGGLRVNDGTTANSLFPQIVRVKDDPASGRIEELADDDAEDKPDTDGANESTAEGDPIESGSRADDFSTSTDAFFHVQFEQNPLDGSADMAVTAKLKSLELVWNPQVVVEIVRFFKPPERHMDSIAALMETASATVEGLRQQTRAGLEFALEEHKTINAKLDLQAPLIIVPEDIEAEMTRCLIVDAGHISVTSELVDKETLKEIQSKQRQSYSEEDYKRLESLMYDKFVLKLQDTQVLIGPSVKAAKEQLTDANSSRSMHIIDRTNVDFLVETCIVPKSPLTKLKLSGHLPVLNASVSDMKYKSLMRLIDVALPKLGDDSEEPSPEVARPAEQEVKRPRAESSLSQQKRRKSRALSTSFQQQRRKSRALSTSFQFSAQRQAILSEGESDDDDDDVVFQDASDGSADQSLKIQQKNFELNFKVDKLQGSLYKSDPDGEKPDQLLVEVVAQSFHIEVAVRTFDISAEVSLHAFNIDDCLSDPTPEFKSLVSSGEASDDKHLVHVKYTKVNRNSPEFMSVYGGVDTNIDVDISTINFVVTRMTVLQLLDFILVTFTNPENGATPDNAIKDADESEDPTIEVTPPPAKPDKLKVKVKLQSIVLVLNNDGIRLATLSLMTADVGVFLMGKTMRVGARLGDLSLLDDINQGASEESSLRNLITIQGDDLADFQYETFDAENTSTYPGYDSSIKLTAGSFKVNFVEEPFRKIIDFMVKFGQMKAIVDRAREAAANQAAQIQESANKIHFDITVKTPIVVFPRVMVAGRPKRDLITAYLGEIYLQNKFVPLDDSEAAPIAMKMTTGIRNIRLTSDFYFDKDQHEELELIDKVDINFHITYAEHQKGLKRPDTEIVGDMTDFNLRITQQQLKFLLELSRSVPAAFAADNDVEQEAIEDLPESTVARANSGKIGSSEEIAKGTDDDKKVDLGPEVRVDGENWSKLDLVFNVKTIGLELILAKDNEPVGDLEASSLSKFSLDNTNVKLRMISDGSLESEFVTHSFTIQDSRTRETNKFRKIMTSTTKDVDQFMASVTISAGKEQNLIAIVAIDSPRIIFALDYLFAIQSFIAGGLEVDEPAVPDDLDDSSVEESDAESFRTDRPQLPGRPQSTRAIKDSEGSGKPEEQQSGMSIAFRVNVVDAQIILIANPLSSNSEAIVLGTRQILISQQHAMTLQVSKTGMFLCRMDRFEDSRLRILDDFSLTLSMDSSKPSTTSIHIDVEPLVLRLSLRDILLALQIVSKASELSGDAVKEEKSASDVKAKQLKGSDGQALKRRTASGHPNTIAKTKKPGTVAPRPAGRREVARSGSSDNSKFHEELTATLDGIRVVLIGDLHELPILDVSVKGFTTNAHDWSSQLRADTSIDMFINVYNFAKSAWEPLVEPWQLGFQMTKQQDPDQLAIDFTSSKTLEVTVTSATIALASKAAQFLNNQDDVLTKPRGTDAPYRIRNYTGFELNVWHDVPDENESMATKLDDGQEVPWQFEEREKMRENMSSEGSTGVVGVRLEGSGFDSIGKIPVTREGETVYSLRPRQDQILHRLLVEVVLGEDNVKYITFRSPLLVENFTKIPVELGVFDAKEGHLLKIEKIAPGESRPAPVGASFLKQLVVRPDQGFGYSWSNEVLWWRDLLKQPTRTMTCKGEGGEKQRPFYFQMHANYDKSNPLTKIYPYMRLRLSAPIEIENLLPYDFKYRVYDKNTKKDWVNFLRKGGRSPVHVVELSHLLLLSIDMQDTVFKPSEFAIIHSNNQEDYRKETSLVCKDEEGLTLNLKLHYFKIPDSGGACRVTVYSPYVILNKTGLEINIKSKSLLQQAKTAAGQGFHTETDSAQQKARPYMFAFPSDDQRNRAILRVGQSEWSKPQSFDAIGSSVEVVLPSPNKNSEIHVGITVEAGEGKYKMTRVVTLAPRFVLKNRMDEEINVRQPGSSETWSLQPGALKALHFLQKTGAKQLCLCHPGLNNHWSSPFDISDLGTTHVKIARAGQRQKLIRVEVLMEGATIFLHLSTETKNWPFSIRNESDTEFMFYQGNPNIDDEHLEDRSGWRPIRYRLPPRSIMPYAWDYPAAKIKELIIVANGKERHVKLAEIGNLIPMKVPLGQGSRETKVIDLNVVADGPTQTLVLSNYRPSKSMYKQKSRAAESSTSVAGGFEVKAQDTNITFRVQLKLAGVGISLINAKLKELAYVTFRDILLKYSESALYQTVSSSIKWIQIDNQLYGGIFPMILYPSVVPKNTKETESHPSVHFQVTRVKDDSYGVLYIKYATILLQQMTLEIDEDFLYALFEFSKVPGATWSETSEGVLCDESLDIPEPTQDQSGQDMYFELLNIQPMQLDLSFVRTERINVEDKTSSHNPLMFFLNVLLMAIGNINDAPVRLNALMLENARVSASVLTQNMQTHYQGQVMYQVHKILGSADFLGNPVGLFNNLSSGVADIFYEPYQGFIMSDRPEQLGIGIARGATSFVKKSVFGFSDSFSKVSGSIAKGLAAATMDKQFQDRRRMTRARNRPKHALYGVTAGANSFVSSLASGVGGLARKPLEGAEQEGAAGFFKGVGKGLLGFATKPAIGVFDLASNVSEGIRNTTTVFDAEGLDRVRLTRFIGADGIVRPYNQREALGQFWLKQLDNGKYFDEQYLAHLELPREDVVVMLTYSRIMLVKSKKLTSEWDVPLKDVQTISKERTGLSIVLRGGTNGPFIPVGDEGSRNFLYSKIGVAVQEFNKKFKAIE